MPPGVIGLRALLHAGLLLQAGERPLPGGYGVALLQTLLALGAVCVLAWVVLRWSAKAGFGIGRGQHLEIVKRMLLLGVGEGAAPNLLTEVDPSELPQGQPAKASFLEVLRRSPAASASGTPRSASTAATEASQGGEDVATDADEEKGAA
jgi:hypothetical protein